MQHAFPRERGHQIQSVQRAAAILRAFGPGTPELGVGELSRTLDLHKSTVSRLLSTLEREGLVERVAPGEKFRLGFEFARLAGLVTHFGDVRMAARDILDQLAEESHETVHLAIIDGSQVMNVEQVSGAHLVRDTNWVGRRTPLHCVANGKVLLAFQTEVFIRQVLSRPLPRFTARTITDKSELEIELGRIRKRGYAIARGEIEEGLNAVAAPIRDSSAQVVAAISVSGPSYRLYQAHLRELGQLCLNYGNQISARMGYARNSEH